ncbi:MAG: thioredoxin family protein [Victivallales bacterium]|nr:thioredoxin family protein [Victivallales bacterium]
MLPGWRADLQTALAEAQANSQDVLLEFWGQACRSCALMKKTSWQAPPVVEALSGTCKISVCGEGDEADTATLRQYFRIQGFPSYALLRPRQHNDQ